MSTTTNPPVAAGAGTQQDDNRRRRRKVAAILAGGLVLGLGATYTLASWNDSEFGNGSFKSGTFDLEGSTDGATFGSHASGSPAGLTFAVNPTNLSPTDSVYAPFWVRLAQGTTNAATLAFSGVTASSGDTANLSYKIYDLATTSTTCDLTGVGATGSTQVASATSLAIGAPASSTPITLAVASSSAPGAAHKLCVVVTAGASLAPTTSSAATWQFKATSN